MFYTEYDTFVLLFDTKINHTFVASKKSGKKYERKTD